MCKELTKEQISDIIHMKTEGYSIAEIMQKYPFIKTRSTIYYHLYKAPAEKAQNKVQHIKPIRPDPCEVFLKLSEIKKYCWYESDGKAPEISSIQKYFRSIGLTSEDPAKKSYLLREVVKILKERNFKTKGSKLDISRLEKLLEDAERGGEILPESNNHSPEKLKKGIKD